MIAASPVLFDRAPPSCEMTSHRAHIRQLEDESIFILREVAASFRKPVMMFSIGKDSMVMLRLAEKAFAPAALPFPLLHVDTTWKFQEMLKFRDDYVQKKGHRIIVHTNRDGQDRNINPFDHGASYTDIMKTDALKQALDAHGFDAAMGGARRDEEQSRAKERIFSFRNAQHQWEPKAQRPELWEIYNTQHHRGDSIRVFPLSNWTELDVWRYIEMESIPVVPLYFAAQRPVVQRDSTLIMVDDTRMRLEPGEVPQKQWIRFRTLGCYPLTGAVPSQATTVAQVIQEMETTQQSERSGRLIDQDQAASMEKRKREGYF